MPTEFLRTPEGRYMKIHGMGVLQTEEYRGWKIVRHWGGVEGRKILRTRLPDIHSKAANMADKLNPLQNKANVEIRTISYPAWMGRKVRKAIDAWEEDAKKKFGVR